MRATRSITDRSAGRRRAHTRTAAGATLVLFALVLLAGCGGASPKDGVAHLGSSTSTDSTPTSRPSVESGSAGSSSAQLTSKAVAYANCIRAHGVPGYPDPKVSVHGNEVSVAVAARPEPNFGSAQQACRKLMPSGGTAPHSAPQLSASEQAQVLKLASCMRTHGVPNLPDPNFIEGRLRLPQSVNRNSRAFKMAEQACQALIPSRLRSG